MTRIRLLTCVVVAMVASGAIAWIDSAVRYPFDDGTPTYHRTGHRPDLSEVHTYRIFVEEARGWPMPCLLSTCSSPATLDQWTVVFGIPTGLPARGVRNIPHALPIQPIWGGLAVNTAIFSVVILLIMESTSRVRRSIRRKRRLCIHCGYPQSASATCSECGSKVCLAIPP